MSEHHDLTLEAKPLPRKVSPWVTVLAGMAGGATEALALQPLDVTKTRLQLGKRALLRGGATAGIDLSHPPPFSHPAHRPSCPLGRWLWGCCRLLRARAKTLLVRGTCVCPLRRDLGIGNNATQKCANCFQKTTKTTTTTAQHTLPRGTPWLWPPTPRNTCS